MVLCKNDMEYLLNNSVYFIFEKRDGLLIYFENKKRKIQKQET